MCRGSSVERAEGSRPVTDGGNEAEPQPTVDSVRISVVVPCRNERVRLPAVIAGIEAQTLPPDEVIVVDGMSTDGSREWLCDAAKNRPWLRVVDNPRRTVPTAMNIGLDHTRGRYVARMDTHADYAPTYIAELIGVLDADAGIVAAGSAMNTAGHGAWGRAIAAVLRRPIGMGGAAHRVDRPAGPVDHVFTGCYRRAALVEAGGYNERLLANEDFELDARLRAAGRTIWLTPTAHSTWFGPDSLAALARKMFRYGHYKALTLWLLPNSVKPRQLAPPTLVLALATTVAVRPRWGALALLTYAGTVGAVAARGLRPGEAATWRVVCVPPVIHLAWGIGLLTGLLRFAGKVLRAPRSPSR